MLSAFSRLITAATLCLYAIGFVYAQEPIDSAPDDVQSFLAVWDSLYCGPVQPPLVVSARPVDQLDLTIFEALSPTPPAAPKGPDQSFLEIIGAIRCSECSNPACDCADCDGATCRCGGKPNTKPAPGVMRPDQQQKLLNAAGAMVVSDVKPQPKAVTPDQIAAGLIATLDGIRERPRLVAGVARPTRAQAVQHLLTAANHRGKFTTEQLAGLTDQQVLELHEADRDAMERGLYRSAVVAATSPSVTPLHESGPTVTFSTHSGSAPAGHWYCWNEEAKDWRTYPKPGADYPSLGLTAIRTEQPQPVVRRQPVQTTTTRTNARPFARLFGIQTGPRCVGGVCYQ